MSTEQQYRVIGKSGPGVYWSGKFARNRNGDVIPAGGIFRGDWNAGVEILEAISPPQAEVAACESWCGLPLLDMRVPPGQQNWFRFDACAHPRGCSHHGQCPCYCTQACLDRAKAAPLARCAVHGDGNCSPACDGRNPLARPRTVSARPGSGEGSTAVSKSASLHEQFRERRANLSTRISARGHRFEFSEQDELHADLKTQILAMVRAIEAAQRIDTADATCQVNRLRGKIGNFRAIVRDGEQRKTADIFMAVCREMLPQDIFDDLLVQTRWLRTEDAKLVMQMVAPLFDKRKQP